MIDEQLTSSETLALNPETEIQPVFDAKTVWHGDPRVVGLKDKLGILEEADKVRLSQLFENGGELQGKIIARYQQLCGLLQTECKKMNVTASPILLSDTDRAELLLMAERIQTRGAEIYAKSRELADSLTPGDAEKAKLLVEKVISQYVQAEQAIILHLAQKIKSAEAKKAIEGKPVDTQKSTEWRNQGEAWKNADRTRRIELLKTLASQHADAVTKHGCFSQQPDNYYFFLKPHVVEVKRQSETYVSGVNSAQESLVRKIDQFGADKVVQTPTVDLRNMFTDIQLIGREIKIHLMPNVTDKYMAMDRLLTLCKQIPSLRDHINAIKMSIPDQTQPYTANLYGPEVVIYTNDKAEQMVLGAIIQEFAGLEGTHHCPRMNQEVADGFIYRAQSGGDLKGVLQVHSFELLGKIFDIETNYATIKDSLK